MRFIIKQNDTSPPMEATLFGADGFAKNLSGATVRFHMRERGKSSAKVDANAIVTDAASGTVRYEWDAADTDKVGVFEGEFEVTLASGLVETWPTRGYITVRVVDDIA